MNKSIKRIKIRDLETSTTDYTYNKKDYCWNDLPEGFLSQIPEEYLDNDVFIIRNTNTKRAYSEAFKFMNGRYILKQLIEGGAELKLQTTDRREVYYIVRKIMDGKLDLKGDVEAQTQLIGEKIVVYCNKLYKHLGYKYWGYVYDYLNMIPKETIIIYDTKMNTTTLSTKNVETFAKIPFFLIICEKEEPLRATMEEMIDRGYTKGFYGVALGGMSKTYNIKLLIELSEIRNFYAFIMTDLDLGGIKIFLNIKQWFPCESIGVNPEMLIFAGVDFEDGSEDHITSQKTKKDTITGLKNSINSLDISEEQKEIYRNWIEICKDKRFELNSLTALRLEEDLNISKARDFCDYLISKIEDPDRRWNLSRYDRPTYEEPILYDIDIYRPQFIQDIRKEIDKKIKDINDKLKELINKIAEKQEEIKEDAYKELNEYLDSKELRFKDDWEKLIEDRVNKMYETNKIIHKLLYMRSKSAHKKIQRKNRKYKGEKVVKKPENIITNQTTQLKTLTANQTETLLKMVKKQDLICKRIIRTTPEYKEMKKMLTENETQFTETNFGYYITNLKKELKEMFKELIQTIKRKKKGKSLREGD